ncbi:hypothetical protein P3X46_035110 [Hevea brasiliensis]|uniref:Rx N-terminal domain-containing protein n=1 Tax=Hevea brasiliensis TaxID=3981 RepID=A0ABQ9KDC6_HEVBR|nr:hypothetical protein P3X46_035110 [Hevea brasiliensis]
MNVVGEIVLSTFVEGVLDKLLSMDFLNPIRSEELNKPLEKLKLTLPSVATVGNDAEEKRFEKPVIGAWLKQLKHAVYDAEDVLDEIAFKAMEDQQEPQSQINRKTTSLLTEPGVYGRNDDREKIIRMLISDENVSSNGFCGIPIVGMGGVGKTTLARLVCNDYTVKLWVCGAFRLECMGLCI